MGVFVGRLTGGNVGMDEGFAMGKPLDGRQVGFEDVVRVGLAVGCLIVGVRVGSEVGRRVVGLSVGLAVGCTVVGVKEGTLLEDR